MVSNTVKAGVVMARKCTQCGGSAPELSIYQRVCDKCHKSVQEARARPHTETNTQKRARIHKAICSHFDLDYLEKMRRAQEIDDERRRERQAEIAERKEKEMAELRKKKLANKPKYSLDMVHHYQNVILNAFTRYECLGTGMGGQNLRKAANNISRITKIPYKLLCTTLSAYSEDYVSATAAEQLTRRIAGNYLTLRKNIPLIEIAKGAPAEGWALFRVIGVNNNYVTKKGVPGFNMFFDISTGVLAGTVIKAGYSAGVGKKFGKKLGIKRNELNYFAPKFLTNMLGWAYITELGGYNRPRELDSNPAHKEHNRGLMQGRVDISKCPKNLKPAEYASCLECPIGYGGNAFKSCRYAVRRDNLTVKENGNE